MNLIKDEALKFIRQLQETYFQQRNVNAVLAMVDDEITWIGTGADEICRSKEDAGRFLIAEKAACPGPITVKSQWFEATEIGMDSCSIFGEIQIETTENFIGQTLRISAVCRKSAGEMKLLHVHLSAPDIQQESGDFYPRKLSYQDNKKLRQTVEMQSRELKERNRDLEALTNNIPGGIMSCQNDNDYSIINVSAGFLSMFGYSEEDLAGEFQNQYIRLIHPDDRQNTLATVRSQLKSGDTTESEYRVVLKDGSILWILDRAQLIREDDGSERLYCVLGDITRMRRAQEELRMILDRYQIIIDQSSDIVFEWDVKRDELSISPHWEKKFGYHALTEHVSREIPKSPNIHPDDVPVFTRIIDEVISGIPYTEGEVRIRKAGANYIWCRLRLTAQFNDAGEAVRSVGVIIDIDNEKRVSQQLIERAERDGLTGLYNKATTENLIEEYLQSKGKDGFHALMIVDVDNFKIINDMSGHLFGDSYLSEAAGALKRLFRQSDVVGRIGGDEFIIFLKNVADQQLVRQKAKDVADAFTHILPAESYGQSITVSMGIAMYPDDASDFRTLYKNADRALYHAKWTGKNDFVFYDREECLMPMPAMGQRVSFIGGGIDSDNAVLNINSSLVEYIFHMLYQSQDIETAINLILAIVGRYYDVSRAYIFENCEDDRSCSNTFEWCNDGVSSEKAMLQNISYENLGNYQLNFDQDGVFYCPDITVLPPGLYDILQKQGIKALLQCAIVDNGVFRGYVGFDECRTNRFWLKDQIDTLSIISEVLSIFLLKERSQKQLERTLGMMESILDAQNDCIYVIDAQTYQLRYLNRQTKHYFPDAEIGKKCYQAFFDNDQPCKLCPITEALRGSAEPIEIYNPDTELWIDVDTSPIIWSDGRKHWLVNSHDITKFKKQ